MPLPAFLRTLMSAIIILAANTLPGDTAEIPPETAHTPWFIPGSVSLGTLAYHGRDGRLPYELRQRLEFSLQMLPEPDFTAVKADILLLEEIDFSTLPVAAAASLEAAHRRGVHLVFCRCRQIPPFAADHLPMPLPPAFYLLPGLTAGQAARLEQDFRLGVTPHGRLAFSDRPPGAPTPESPPGVPFADHHLLPLLRTLLWAVRPEPPARFTALNPGKAELISGQPQNALLAILFLAPDGEQNGQLRMQLRLKKGANPISFPLPPLPEGEHQLVARLHSTNGAVLDCALADLPAEPASPRLLLLAPDAGARLPTGTPLRWSCRIAPLAEPATLALYIHDSRRNLWHEQHHKALPGTLAFTWHPPDSDRSFYRLTARLRTATGRELSRQTAEFLLATPEPDLCGVLPCAPALPPFLHKRYGGDRLHPPSAAVHPLPPEWLVQATRIGILLHPLPPPQRPFSPTQLWRELFAGESRLSFGPGTPFQPDFRPTPELLRFAATLHLMQTGFATLMRTFPTLLPASEYLTGQAPSTLDISVRKAGENLIFTLSAGESGGQATLRFPRPGHLYELMAGTALGWQQHLHVELAAGDVRIYSLLPEPVTHLALEAPAEAKPGDSLSLKLAGGRGPHVFNLQLLPPDDNASIVFNRNLPAANGTAACTLHLPLNAPPGNWTVAAKDVNSGVTGYAVILVTAP